MRTLTKNILFLISILSFAVGQLVVSSVLAASDSDDKKPSILSGIKNNEMIIYKPKGHTKAVVTIFTDLECGYCRKLHTEIPKLNDMGIEVRYLAFPRHGIGSNTYNRMVSIWCSSNPRDALEKAMWGEMPANKTCSHSIDAQYQLGRKLGISGTPTLVFQDGTVLGGYETAERIARQAVKHQ